jgi:RNA polymerase sigma-70 factor (ECF subfamily)
MALTHPASVAAPDGSSQGLRARWVGWVAAARFGDRSAFTALHAHFKPMVHAIAIAHVSATDAKDLVQDVFLIAMQRLSTLEDDAAFGGWLATVARNRARKHLRDNPQTLELDETLPGPTPSDEAPDTKKVLKALRELPEAYRETLAMRLIEGLTGPEIAERTGLTPGSVRVNLHRGMQQLKEALGL